MDELRRGALINNKIVEELMDGTESIWWLSFANEVGHLGVVITKANGIALAITKTHILGINPGGEVAGYEMDGEVEKEYLDRLLTRQELKTAGLIE